MNNKFDELTKSLAQSVTRRAALKKFGAGLAGMALAMLGIETAHAERRDKYTCCFYNCHSGGFGAPYRVCQAPGSCPPPGASCVFIRASTKECTAFCL